MQHSHSATSVARRPADHRSAGRRPGHGSVDPPAEPAAATQSAPRSDSQSDQPGVSSLSWSFPGTPADVACSRRWLEAAAIEAWGEGEDTDRLVLAYSEVATNAVVHGTGPVSVAARICPTGARCEIADRSPRFPKPRRAGSDDVGGRGLEMVRRTVDRLRVAADGIGKTVSFVVGHRAG
jgi:anti-sigma regulatory factor (Ser/Thr protein kinase)